MVYIFHGIWKITAENIRTLVGKNNALSVIIARLENLKLRIKYLFLRTSIAVLPEQYSESVSL